MRLSCLGAADRRANAQCSGAVGRRALQPGNAGPRLGALFDKWEGACPAANRRGGLLLLLPPGRRRRSPPQPVAGLGGRHRRDGAWGNDNRLSTDSDLQGASSRCLAPDGHSSTLFRPRGARHFQGAQQQQRQPEWQLRLTKHLRSLQYDYYNWRQDTMSDLQLFICCNAAVFLAGAWIQGALVRQLDSSASPPDGEDLFSGAWRSLYSVLAVVLGQDLPDAYASIPSQLFAVIIALFGLASFALVLALIEQVVLEVLESNVKRGCAVYEQGHTVVLAWCESARDLSQLTRILSQLCAANSGAGGGTVVVLTQQRGKLEMETLLREAIPPGDRLGTKFVFRQGSPLDPAALELVAAAQAHSVIICGDYSRPARDGDAQVLRTAVLLDELVEAARPPGGGPVIVAQIKSGDRMPVLHYACSERVVAVPTSKINAHRYARLLQHPIMAVLSHIDTDYYSHAHARIDSWPQLEGCRFGELHFRFPNCLITGLYNTETGFCQLNPPADTRVQRADSVVMLRPDWSQVEHRGPLDGTIPVDPGSWDPGQYVMSSHDDRPLGSDGQYGSESIRGVPGEQCGGERSGSSDAGSGMALGTSSSNGSSHASSRHSSSSKSNGVLGSRRFRGRSVLSVEDAQGVYLLPMQYSNTLLTASDLLICGWADNTFMWHLLQELDHSSQALPPGSLVTLFNEHDWPVGFLEMLCRKNGITKLRIRHVRGDPRSAADTRRLADVSAFSAAIVVCDSLWMAEEQPLRAEREGARASQMLSQADMLRLDAAVMLAQLNLRMLNEERGQPGINIICERLTYVGSTRFEDSRRPPLGIAVNYASYSARALVQAAVDPRFVEVHLQLGDESDVVAQDASAFAAEGEALSFLQLQARAASVQQVLLGYYVIPLTSAKPLEVVINPQGLMERSKVQVWNAGDARCKLITLALKKRAAHAEAASMDNAATDHDRSAEPCGVGSG